MSETGAKYTDPPAYGRTYTLGSAARQARALERQADALERLATAMTLLALVEASRHLSLIERERLYVGKAMNNVVAVLCADYERPE